MNNLRIHLYFESWSGQGFPIISKVSVESRLKSRLSLGHPSVDHCSVKGSGEVSVEVSVESRLLSDRKVSVAGRVRVG